MKNFLIFSSLTLAIIIATTTLTSFSWPNEDETVTITAPNYNGFQVGACYNITGKSSIDPGHHVWVFARKEDYNPLWFPQGEALMNDEHDAWQRNACFGTAADIGYKFDVAVVVLDDAEHHRILAIWQECMKTGRWTPIEMPHTVSSNIALRSVLKISHN